ncbi:MAG TPA: DNA polymerase [Candidatus Paceibacterota bacterium]|nr:DNA polymerase [Candidatus Paceibacterota bacterium]
MKRLILLDSHAILHRAYHALPDFATSKGEPTGALYGLSTMLIKIIEDLKPDYIVACYDLKGPTYRHEIYKEYKAGRQKTDDDLIAQINRSQDVFKALNIPIYSKEGFEADDIIGTIVEQIAKQKSKEGKKEEDEVEIIIASGDMDTMQLIDGTDVKVYTLKKGIKDTIMYDEEAVKERFGFGPELIPDYKGLRGDPSDNIPGIRGIGEKSGTTLITTFGTIENMYKELEKGNEKAFTMAGMTPRLIQLLKDNKEEAEFSKMLATIRRDAPIKFVLPEKTFKEDLDIKKVGEFWTSLEFRTLLPRLEKAVHGKPSQLFDEVKKPQEVIDQLELEKTALALWVVTSNITNPTLEDIYSFARVENFKEATEIIFAEMDKRRLRKVYEGIELPLIPIVHSMEKRGVRINRKLLADLSKKYHATLSELEKNIWREAGVEFNIASPKQLGEILFDKLGLKPKNAKKTEGGARSTKESELEKMRDMHPIIPFIFEYREISKLLGTYIDAIPPLLDDNDRLHTHFILSGSTTGRMASQDPGLQNIPIKTELGKNIRYAFIPEKGFKLVSFDYSQMELRIAAFLSGDQKLIDIFKKGEDVHTAVAASVFKVDPKEVTSEMRRRAKVINFGIIYGMGVLALKQNLGSTREEAQIFLNEYFATFSTLAAYLDAVKAETARRGYTETFYGRRRYFEGIKSKIPFVRAAAERMAINAPIQGTEADVIKLAMIKVDAYIKEKGWENDVYLLLQVHDELVCEIREDKAEEISKEITRIMQTVMDPKETHGVVLTAQAAIGDSWGELK